MSTYESYKQTMSKIADINHSIAVLSWDKETYIPKDGAAHRSQQIATLSGIAHEIFTKPSFGESLKTLSEDKQLNAQEKKNVNLTLKDFDRATKFDEAFVIAKSQAVSTCYQAWIKARSENNWSIFAEKFDTLLDYTKEESERFGYEDHPYDPLLDLYEPSMTTKKLDTIFSDVQNKLYPLMASIKAADQVEDDFLFKIYDKDKQWSYGLDILKCMGYDFNKGRQDVSEHPFTTSFSPNDVRVTTRLKEDNFPMMLWSCIHEGGHALYEQGLPIDQYGLPSGSAISLGIHESQSRLWENNVGRSEGYWSHHFPRMQKEFPSQLSGVSLKQFFAAINRIEPNSIRTEADELHYHFHVMIRYMIEKELITGELAVNDLKNRWNALYKKYLGSEPPSDKEGVLQDIHWSLGSFGYFPTYSLGSFYAAQFYEQAAMDIPQLEPEIIMGNTQPLLNWLRENIHQYGHSVEAEEICKKITGTGLQLDSFMKYANKKYSKIYGL